MFLVWSPAEGQTEEDAYGYPIAAAESSDAAEMWAEQSDRTSADYGIVRGNSVTVMVRPFPLDDGQPAVPFVVEGESVPSYHAHRAETCALCGKAWPPCELVLPRETSSSRRKWAHASCARRAQQETAAADVAEPRS